eukprot:3108367-Rhodomonas_salina.2
MTAINANVKFNALIFAVTLFFLLRRFYTVPEEAVLVESCPRKYVLLSSRPHWNEYALYQQSQSIVISDQSIHVVHEKLITASGSTGNGTCVKLQNAVESCGSLLQWMSQKDNSSHSNQTETSLSHPNAEACWSCPLASILALCRTKDTQKKCSECRLDQVPIPISTCGSSTVSGADIA